MSISPFSEYSGLISFRTDWFHLLAVQGILKSSSTPQFKSINSLAVSFLYDPTLTSIHDYWKTLALTTQTFVSKVMSPLFNMLSRLVTALHLVLGNLMDRGAWQAIVHWAVKESDTTLQLNNVSHWKTQWADVKTVAENQMNSVHFHLYCKSFSATSKGTVGAWFLQSLKTNQAKLPSRTKPT